MSPKRVKACAQSAVNSTLVVRRSTSRNSCIHNHIHYIQLVLKVICSRFKIPGTYR